MTIAINFFLQMPREKNQGSCYKKEDIPHISVREKYDHVLKYFNITVNGYLPVNILGFFC